MYGYWKQSRVLLLGTNIGTFLDWCHQAVDGIFHVVRAFDNDEVTHVDDSVDPVRDLETIQHELCQKDLEFVEKALAAENKAVRGTQGKYL